MRSKQPLPACQELAVALQAYAAQSLAANARFDAVFLLLRAPGLTPPLHSGHGRLTVAGIGGLWQD